MNEAEYLKMFEIGCWVIESGEKELEVRKEGDKTFGWYQVKGPRQIKKIEKNDNFGLYPPKFYFEDGTEAYVWGRTIFTKGKKTEVRRFRLATEEEIMEWRLRNMFEEK